MVWFTILVPDLVFLFALLPRLLGKAQVRVFPMPVLISPV